MSRIAILVTTLSILLAPLGARADTGSGPSIFGFDKVHPEVKETGPPSCNTPKETAFEACQQKGQVIIGGPDANPGCEGAVAMRPGTHTTGKITINTGGTLTIADDAATDLQLTTTGIEIAGGSLVIGAPDCPIGTGGPDRQVTIHFTGKRPTDCGSLDLTKPLCPGYDKGLQVDAGGTLKMYGRKGVPGAAPNNGVNWTYLSQPAGDPTKFSTAAGVLEPPPGKSAADAKVIYTAARVDSGDGGAGLSAWRQGDWIAIATTSFSAWETEFVQIASAVKDPTPGATGSVITLKQGLAYYHFGGAPPGDPSTEANYTAGSSSTPSQNLNFGVDERAEVGLISRSIVLTSDSDTPSSSKHWGGELKFLKGFTQVALQGIELQKFGKEQLGSYPIHFHLDGDLSATPVLIDSNSIDHSYNKCITTHSTQNITYTNNVCARITGHIFYEEVGDESNVTFNGNLGIGAMSNSFDVNTTAESTRAKLIKDYYWIGDNMFSPPAQQSGVTDFDQINVFDTDSQYVLNSPNGGQPFISPRGTCGTLALANAIPNGGISLAGGTPNAQPITCYPGNNEVTPPGKGNIYFEPPSGFWLLNPSAKLTNNSIAGCQDTGAAYWYATPPDPNNNAVKFIPIGPSYPEPHGIFANNSGHGCYRGLNDDQFEVSTADQLFGYQTGVNNAGATSPQVDEFDGLTLSRIRYRGVWLRPSFFYLKDARLSTNRRGISFVTSGGADGNYPGVWSLLGHSTMVGISTNNVDRFGPCGSRVIVNGVGQVRGAQWGCIDQTVPIKGQPANGGEFTENGYPVPDNNMFGFMSYDGPPLMVKDRFVNFLTDPSTSLWTTIDQNVVKTWAFVNAYKHYEGDAAIGWLDSNQSAYPTAATTDQLSFTNVDFRHQVYTDKVNIGTFNDGDKNTSIIDMDGTLSGYAVADPKATPAFAASLNNLPFNASSNSVDECRAEGLQNADLEGRPTAAMVPSGVGQLEFEALYPKNPDPPWPPIRPEPNLLLNSTQLLTFFKDDIDFSQHGSMPLHSRNGNGIWEPKVASSYGYVVRADPYTDPSFGTSGVGIPPVVDVSLVDTVKPKISADNPFYVQIGICYSNTNGGHPTDAKAFTVTHGYKSWGGGGVQTNDLGLRQYFNQLVGLYNNETCFNLDSANAGNLDPVSGCPADGITLQISGTCPTGASKITDQTGQAACLFAKNTPKLNAGTLAEMTTNGKLNGPPNLSNYHYDSTTGMLYLWIAQTEPNAPGPSPLGNCTGSANDPPFCPQNTGAGAVSTGEPYYNCPAQGCPTYRIFLNDGDYVPGQSTCPVFGSTGDAAGWTTGTGGATWPGPAANQPVLVDFDNPNKVVVRNAVTSGLAPHYEDADPPACATNQ